MLSGGIFLKASRFHAKVYDKLQVISVNFSFNAVWLSICYPTPQMRQSWPHLRSSLGWFAVASMSNKDLFVQILVIYVLITDYCFWFWRSRYISELPLLQPLLAGYLNCQNLLLPICAFFSFLLFGNQIFQDSDIQREFHV